MFFISAPDHCLCKINPYEGLRVYAAMDALNNAISNFLSIGVMWHEAALPMLRAMLDDKINEHINAGREAWESLYAEIAASVAQKNAAKIANSAVDAVVEALAK